MLHNHLGAYKNYKYLGLQYQRFLGGGSQAQVVLKSPPSSGDLNVQLGLRTTSHDGEKLLPQEMVEEDRHVRVPTSSRSAKGFLS